MTVGTQTPKISYIGDAVQDTFAFDFRLLQNADLEVYVDGNIAVLTTDYTIQNLTLVGGDVVFQPGSIPIQDALIDIIRKTSADQLVDYQAYDAFPAETHELALDKLTMLAQEFRRVIDEILLGSGLPLDATDTFWDAGSRLLRNLAGPPLLPTDAVNKSYADSLLAAGFDPASDQLITGTWTFANDIPGTTIGNLTTSDLLNFTKIDRNEGVIAQWTFRDGAGSARKVGARNPRERIVLVDDTPTQADEGAILRVTGSITDISLPTLEAQTTFTILAEGDGFNIVEDGVTLTWFDGSGDAGAKTGTRAIAKWGAAEVMYKDATNVTIFGTGLS